MSNVTIRHVNSLGLKYEVLKEIKHWKQSCTDCVSEVRGNINSLRESRATIKREINVARAQLETAVRRLEEECELELSNMVTDEMRTMTEFVEKLEHNRKRLNAIETSLKSNLVGFKLKRAIDDGKLQTIATRDALIKIRKYEIASRVEFRMSKHLQTVLDIEKTLGSLSFTSSSGSTRERDRKCKVGPITEEKTGMKRIDETVLDDERKMGEKSTGRVLVSNNMSRSTSIDETVVNDLEFLLKMDSKYEHTLKPFINDVKNISAKYKVNQLSRKDVTMSTFKPNRTIKCKQSLVGIHRPQSDKTNKPNDTSVELRPSKSAREDTRQDRKQVPSNNCLNDLRFEPFEEQGPIADTLYRKQKEMTVRYHNYDFVKEITVVRDEDIVSPYDYLITNRDKYVNDLLPSSGSKLVTAISSVTYKPSDSLSSGPVYVKPSRQHAPNSYFCHIAKFHTKKHEQETDLCRLTSILALDNGQIVITDINHLQIMLFAPDFTYLDALECPSPCGLGVVSENTVAVTLFHNRKIMHVKVHMLHLERHKELHMQCKDPLFAVTYKCGRHFVLCSAGDIHIMDDDGKQSGTIRTGIDNGDARFMDVSQDATRIVVSGKDRIVCISDTGEKLWQYKSRDKHRRFTPGDIAQYRERIFVVDWSGNKVLELSTDGTYVRDVVTDNIESPHAIAIQHKYGKMLISQSNFFKQEARSRSIKVFQIK